MSHRNPGPLTAAQRRMKARNGRCPYCKLRRQHKNTSPYQCIAALQGQVEYLRRKLREAEADELSASETLARLVVQGRVGPIEGRK